MTSLATFNQKITVTTREQAWEEANKIFPTDYEKDETASKNIPTRWTYRPDMPTGWVKLGSGVKTTSCKADTLHMGVCYRFCHDIL